ncbi:transcriptional repressor [Mycoplasmatota bacterium]|nr:transcriptional repressor [Mycoplasmatota bacterium]
MIQETLLSKIGLKKTKHRLFLLKLLTASENPLTAEEIYHYCKQNDLSINLSTVYRILDTFLEKGIVIKPIVKEDTKACYKLNHHQHTHYLICHKCQKMVEIDFCPFNGFEKTIENETNFTITNHKLELFGICPNCKKNNPPT